MKHGYARISKKQSFDKQIDILVSEGVRAENISKEASTKSGTQLTKRIDKLQKGDTLVVAALDRLSRDYKKTEELLKAIIKKEATAFIVKGNKEIKSESDILSVILPDVLCEMHDGKAY